MLRTLWDAATRLDPSVVGQDEATMPLSRPGGLAELWHRSGLVDVDHGGVGPGPFELTSRAWWVRGTVPS